MCKNIIIYSFLKQFRNKSALETIREIRKIRGIFGLFRGFWVTFNRDTLANGAYFMTYYVLKEFSKENMKLNSSFLFLLTHGFSGGVAGAVCWIFIHPFDTIKTIIQVNDMNAPTLKIRDVYMTLTYNKGIISGFYNLYRGGFPSLCYLVLSSAIFFIFYEKFKQKFNFI